MKKERRQIHGVKSLRHRETVSHTRRETMSIDTDTLERVFTGSGWVRVGVSLYYRAYFNGVVAYVRISNTGGELQVKHRISQISKTIPQSILTSTGNGLLAWVDSNVNALSKEIRH